MFLSRLIFCSLVIRTGTHLGESFLMCKYPCKMFLTCSSEMYAMSTISHSSTQWFCFDIVFFFTIISGVVRFFRTSTVLIIKITRATTLIFTNPKNEQCHTMVKTYSKFDINPSCYRLTDAFQIEIMNGRTNFNLSIFV